MFPLYQRYVPTLARLLMCVIFLVSGFSKLTNFTGTEAYMTTHGMTSGTAILLIGAIIVEIGGGLALLFGFRVRLVSVVLFLYLIPTTIIFHHFWADTDPATRQAFLKNLAIGGGLLALSVAGAGVLSMDATIAQHAGRSGRSGGGERFDVSGPGEPSGVSRRVRPRLTRRLTPLGSPGLTSQWTSRCWGSTDSRQPCACAG